MAYDNLKSFENIMAETCLIQKNIVSLSVLTLTFFYYYLTGASSSPQRILKFRIKKPWTACLGENKKSWKEQAARGSLAPLQFL